MAKLKDFVDNGGIVVPDIFKGQNSISNEIVNEAFNKARGSYEEVKISQYSNNRVALDLSGQKGWLVASERFAYFPGWKATLNGKNIEIFRADNAISALYLEGEKGSLVFEYKPDSYVKGKLISITALTAILLYFGYFAYKKKFGGKNQDRN